MAGTSYFNAGSRGTASSPFHQLKPLTIPTATNTIKSSGWEYARFIRPTASVDKVIKFTGSTATELDIFTVNSDGSLTQIANLDSISHLSSSTFNKFYMSTADQCLYALLANGTQLRLVKVNDTTGVLTTIGSSFTPATYINWDSGAVMYEDNTGHLRIISNGYSHHINKTTGAVVDQDTPIVLGSLTTAGLNYITADGTVGLGSMGANSANLNLIDIENLFSVATACIPLTSLDVSLVSSKSMTRNGGDFNFGFMSDNDKICLMNLYGSPKNQFGYVNRSDFDEFLRSIVDWYSGA